MTKILNPDYKPHRDLGESTVQWDGLKAKIQTYLDANADKATLTEQDVRDLDPKFDDDAIWAQISSEMRLIEIP